MTYGLAPHGRLTYADSRLSQNVSISMSDTAAISAVTVNDLLPLLRDALKITATASQQSHLFDVLTDSARADTQTLLAWLLLASSTGTLTDTPAGTPYWAAPIVDTLMAVDTGTSKLDAIDALVEAIALHALLQPGWDASAVDSAQFNGAYVAALSAAASAVDAAIAAATATDSIRMTFVAADGAVTTATAAGVLQAFENLADSASLFVSVRLTSGEYSAWVLNTESKAPTEYRNYEFNSFCEFPPGSGRYYGASDAGIFRLDGDTDAGTPIDAWIRTGLWNLGTGQKKRVPDLYIGYTSDGTLVLKVITTNDRGAKVEDWYKMVERPADATRSNRIKIGRGLASVYWQFELHNVAGSDFSLDAVQLFPMMMDRRI